MRFIDIHHHIVYGLDDGPQTFEESVAMLHAACRDGIETIIATTHAAPGKHSFPLAEYLQRLKELSNYCALYALPLRLLPGSEVLFEESAVRHLQDGRIPTLANSLHVLVEFSPDVAYEGLFAGLRQLANAGYLPVLAHIERYECFVRKPTHVSEIKGALPVKLQVNCGPLIRRNGMRLRRFLRQVLETNLVDFVTTDAHTTYSRKTCMTKGYQVLAEHYGREYADDLTGKNQGSLMGLNGVTTHGTTDLESC